MKTKILILQNELSAYNVSVFNKIAEHYDLTVGFYAKDKSSSICRFKKKIFEVIKIGSLVFVKGLRKFAKNFDVVCIVPDLHVVSYCLLPYLKSKNRIANWSIGFRVSYTHPYETTRKHTFVDRVFQSVLSHCDATIFYMDKAKEFWAGTTLDLNKVFIAPNTTSVLPVNFNKKKKNILFIGTLYKGKGLDILIDSYKKAVERANICNELHIVGDGAERKHIEQLISTYHLEHRVKIYGAIYEESELAEIFSNALVCISPTQAGLSVPKSMGYGVPFITKETAITGGEIYHITSGENGIIYREDDELEHILIDLERNTNKYMEMGMKAKVYYDNTATVDHMARGAMQAFEYALCNIPTSDKI